MDRDMRYRILVNLVRADRPRYWTWHCPSCQMPAAELANADVISCTDIIDMKNQDKTLVGVRCDGRSPRGIGRCDTWYYFNLSDKPPKEAR